MPYSDIHTYAYGDNKESMRECMNHTDVNLKNPFSWTALHIASWIGNYDIVKCLLDHPDIDISIKDTLGRSSIDIAKSNGHPEIVMLLTNHCT